MKVTVAHMGRFAYIIQSMLEDLGLDVVVAPRPSKSTLSLGVQHSPEFACLPLKICLGTFIEAAKKGADTVLMAGGLGPCRFGYYAEIERDILHELGYDLRMVVLEPPKGRFRELYHTLRDFLPGRSIAQVLRALKFVLVKNAVIDDLDALVKRQAASELDQGSCEELFSGYTKRILSCSGYHELKNIADEAKEAVLCVPGNPVLVKGTVAVVGEIYVALETFVNMDIQRRLNLLRVEVIPTVTLSKWVGENLTLNPMRRARYRRILLKESGDYLQHWVGGEGLETVANAALHGRLGTDGVVQVAPFTCMPEIVGESILPRVSRDLEIPCMSFFFDEHSSETGLDTRLEAFVDLMAMRRQKLKSLA